MRFPLPIQSFLRNDIMSDSEFTAIPVRPCIKCGATERYKSGACKACARAIAAAWRAANPDKAKAAALTWRAVNADYVKAKGAAWHAANADKVKAQNAAWRAANLDRAKARDAAWYAANKDHAQATQAMWRAANPEAQRIIQQNRRARKKKVGGKLSGGLSAKLFKLQKGKCPCCNQPLGDDYHLDHKMPLALGGANVDDNMQLLRAFCNFQKSKKHPVEFMQSRGFLL